MKQVYSNQNNLLAINSRNLLESSGIAVELKNEFTAGSAVPGHAIAIEIWVNDSDYDQAINLLASAANDDGQDWVCKKCNENNTASFEICWSCQSEHT
ncbi:DUF2007 domain-containing protein [Paraglaciecola sp.]|uniref:putative signal transducing protein n=1 Tax=Paraglaciecola sp. TaxID=1920173 RepID=UPI003EF59FFD